MTAVKNDVGEGELARGSPLAATPAAVPQRQVVYVHDCENDRTSVGVHVPGQHGYVYQPADKPSNG